MLRGSRYSRVLCAILVCFSTNSLLANDGDWPRWRGVHLDGTIQTGKKLPLGKDGYGLKEAWRADIGSAYSCFSVAGRYALNMGEDGTNDFVIALDANTGKTLWRYQLGPSYKGHNGSHDGPNSTPVIDGKKVYALGPNGHLVALGLEKGNLIWKKHLTDDLKTPIPFHGFTTVPLVLGERLFVQTGGDNHELAALNKNTGEVLWTMGKNAVDYHSPIVAKLNGVEQLVVSGREKISGVDPATGKALWEHVPSVRGGTLNPVYVGPDKLLINSGRRGSAMVQVTGSGDQVEIKELWRSRDLGAFNVPVRHGDYLYGYSGNFLTCVEVETGKQAWKSRPPGAGFLILVDDFLVIQAQAGRVHVANATPEGYQEVASVDVFDSISWTPPIFANGRIYARNLKDGVSLNIEKVNDVVVKTEETVRQHHIEGTRFAAFLDSVAKAENKAATIDSYLSKHKQFPIIEDGKYAHLVYHGEVKDITLVGDMIETNTEAIMNRVKGTNLYYASFELPKDARLNYVYNKDFGNRIADPRNPNKVTSQFGEMSQLAMPDWKKPHTLNAPKGKRGNVKDVPFKSAHLTSDLSLKVYTPVGYDSSKDRYPVVYVNYGDNAVNLGQMPNVLDNTIGKTVSPIIAVFISSSGSGQEYARGGRDNHARMLVEELVPMIDKNYRTKATAENRAIMGGDEGGYAALYAALKHPGTFSKMAGQSTHLMKGHGGEEVEALVQANANGDMEIYMDWGAFDYRNTRGNYDWRSLNQEMTDLMKKQGYNIKTHKHNEGWGWATWRNRTHTILEGLFPK